MLRRYLKRMDKSKKSPKKGSRVPTQKIKELQSTADPSNEQSISGCFAFVRWEDGYTGKIYSPADIMGRDESPMKMLDLRSGDPILAKWSDGRFYRATVEYVSGKDATKPPEVVPTVNVDPSDSISEADTIIIDRSPQSVYGELIASLNQSPDGEHATGRKTTGPPSYGSNKESTVDPSFYVWHASNPSSYGLSSFGLSLYGGPTPSPSPYGLTSFGPSHYVAPTPSPSSSFGSGSSHYEAPTPSPSSSSYGRNSSGSSHYGGHTPSPSLSGVNSSGPSPADFHTPSPSQYSRNSSGPSPADIHTLSPSQYGRNSSGPSPADIHTLSPSQYGRNSSGPSPADIHTLSPSQSGVNTSAPLAIGASPPDSGQEAAKNTWAPCDQCKEEVEKILCEKNKIDEVLLKIDPDQVQTLRNIISEKHRSAPSPSGEQELFPGSSIYISSFRLPAMNQASKPNCMRLFHALFEHFFTNEDCQNAVPFGRPGKEGKQVLDRTKVNGILTYVLRCATLPGWDNIEETKLKKAFVNKCRARAAAKE